MKLIDVSYFSSAPHIIANAVGSPNSNMANGAYKVITDLIIEYHDGFIRDVVGNGADEIIEELEKCELEQDMSEDLAAVVKDLCEPFGKFLHFHVLRYAQSMSGITGVYNLVTSDNRVSPRTLQTQVWNDMVRQIRELSARYNWKTKCNLLAFVNPYNL